MVLWSFGAEVGRSAGRVVPSSGRVQLLNRNDLEDIVPLPLLIPIAIALVGAGGAGVVAGIDGVDKMNDASNRRDAAKKRHDKANRGLTALRDRADNRIGQYGEFQLQVQRDTLGAFAEWLQDNEHKVKRLDGTVVDGVEIKVPNLPELQRQVIQAENLLAGTVTSVLTGVAARQAALMGVRWAATAGTGAAISGLSGAAAQSATLAWLGGGTLAAGGGGVAMGGLMLTGFGAAPALLLTGLKLNAEGEKALTRARQIEADVNVDVAKMERQEQRLIRIMRRVEELDDVLTGLNERALKELAKLRSLDFDPELHVEAFMSTALLMRSVREVLNATILGEDGDVSRQSEDVVIKYTTTD